MVLDNLNLLCSKPDSQHAIVYAYINFYTLSCIIAKI